MTDTSLAIQFANPSGADGECELLIEQEPWGKDVGVTTEMTGILGIASAINGTRWPEVFCGGMNGYFNATVYVYPCDFGMDYQFHVSHGSVTSGSTDIKYREEVVQCSMQLVHTLDYPLYQLGSMSWIGRCYDSQGNFVSRPQVSIYGNQVVISEEVYGSVRVRYTVVRHTYHVTISRRFAAIENKYESVAYAVWDGGVKWIDIEAPAGFEAYDGDCGNGSYHDDNLQDGYISDQLGRTDICGHRYTDIPVASSADRRITVQYCTQITTSDEISPGSEDYETRDVGDCPPDD